MIEATRPDLERTEPPGILERGEPAVGDPDRRLRVAPLVRLALVSAVSVALLVAAYRTTSDGGPLSTSFSFFWLGMLLFFGYVCWSALSKRANGYPRVSLVAVAIMTAVPRILRSPTHFYLNDEFGHVFAVGRMLETGRLFLPNPIVVESPSYPGLETLTVGVRNATHLPLIVIALAFIVLWHIASVTGLYQLASLVTGDKRVAFFAALIYALNPQMGQLDSWFAYEAFGLPLCIWTIVFVISAQRSVAGERRRLWVLGAVTGLACIVTHHISGGVVVIGCLLVAPSYYRKTIRSEAVAPLTAACVAGAVFVAWAQWRGSHLEAYFGPYFSNGYHALLSHLTGRSYGSNQRTPFSGAAQIPLYERLATYQCEIFLLVATIVVTLRGRRTFLIGGGVVLGLSWLYFLLLPLLLSSEGQQIAHRSWAYTYIGLSIVLATAGKQLVGLLRESTRAYGRIVENLTVRTCSCLAVIILLLGGYGAGVNYLEMFPGPFVFQSDGRNVPAELVSVASWMNTHGGHDEPFAADWRSSVLIAATTLGQPEPDLAMAVIQPPGPLSAPVVAAARRRLRFVVVDQRLTTDPADGNYFVPALDQGGTPLPTTSIQKLFFFGWLHLVHRTTHYLVFAVDGAG